MIVIFDITHYLIWKKYYRIIGEFSFADKKKLGNSVLHIFFMQATKLNLCNIHFQILILNDFSYACLMNELMKLQYISN